MKAKNSVIYLLHYESLMSFYLFPFFSGLLKVLPKTVQTVIQS